MAKENTDRKVGKPDKWMVFLVGLGAAATVVAAPGDKAPGSAPVTVINDATQPIPVAGEVTASVSGAVEVSSLPVALTDRIDLMLDLLESLLDRSEPAAFYETVTMEFTPPDIGFVDLRKEIMATSVTVSAENDTAEITLSPYPGSGCWNVYPPPDNSRDNGREEHCHFTIGSDDQSLPSITSISFPSPIPVSRVRAVCHNNFEPCELKVTITGRKGL